MCQFTSGSTLPAGEAARKTLADYVPITGVYPVGRLDYDSEGLVFLTDDGNLQHRLADPRFGHSRTYWAQVEGLIDEKALEHLRCGLRIQDRVTNPSQAKCISNVAIPERVPPIRQRLSIPTSWIELTLTEGRNRQVRRMTAAVGFPTLRLIRVSLGPFTLDGLAAGAWRYLTAKEWNAAQSLQRKPPIRKKRLK